MNCRRFAGGCWDHEVECARLAGSWRHGVSGAEAAKGGGDVVHSLEAAPQGLGSRLAIGFAGEEAAELGDGANHLAQRRRLLGRGLTGLEDAMTAFHWSSSKATVQERALVQMQRPINYIGMLNWLRSS